TAAGPASAGAGGGGLRRSAAGVLARRRADATTPDGRSPMSGNLFTRREMITSSAAALASATIANGSRALAQNAAPSAPQEHEHHEHHEHDHEQPVAQPAGEADRDYTAVITPNGWTLPHKIVDGVKVFHLVAEEIHGHEFAPGL